MKVLTKSTDYAVRALIVLAKNKDKYVSARTISKEQEIPYQFLRRVLQVLIKNKMVISKEGIGGGFKIKKDPGKIKVSDIIISFQGKIELSECMFRKEVCCNRSTCVLRKEIKEIEKVVKERFDKVTIQKLIKKGTII
jgi:Rrf2 family protein